MSVPLHNLFNSMPRFQPNEIGKVGFVNGIYIVFEVGETYHGMDRIVRVGTHNSDGRLCARLRNHFISENKDGSIFRKNVGKAILNKGNSPYLSIWSMDSSRKGAMAGVVGYNPTLQREIETAVSEYMRTNFSFTCFPVPTESDRLRLEEGIISSLNNAADFTASISWLGNSSPETEIRESGLWLKRGLKSTPLTEGEYARVVEFCSDAFSIGR